MSERQASATKHLRRNITILVIVLLTPLLISFLIYTAAVSFGNSSAPPIVYGIAAACSTSGGASYIWQHNAGCADTAAGTGAGNLAYDPSLPTGVVNLFNAMLLIIVFIVILIQAYRIVGAFLESAED